MNLLLGLCNIPTSSSRPPLEPSRTTNRKSAKQTSKHGQRHQRQRDPHPRSETDLCRCWDQVLFKLGFAGSKECKDDDHKEEAGEGDEEGEECCDRVEPALSEARVEGEEGE